MSTYGSEGMSGYTSQFEEELFSYRPELTKKPDFDDFWRDTLDRAAKLSLDSVVEPYDYPSPYVDVFAVSFRGFDETRLRGWYLLPKFTGKKKHPCLVHYHGYTQSKGSPSGFAQWCLLGMAVLSVDCRGQNGDTGDCAPYTSGAAQSVVSKGLLDKNEYYYRAVYADSVKALDFLWQRDEIDRGAVVVEGASQGGALAAAVAALDPRPRLALTDVPSMSNLARRVQDSTGAFSAVADYLKAHPNHTDRVLDTLSYFDTMNLAERISCRVFASAALRDNVCPAKMYFATYNRIKSPKDVAVYPFNGHEGGREIHNELKLRCVWDRLLGPNSA